MALYEMRKFVAPEFIFGVGARHRVGYYARNYGARRVLVVSDPGVAQAGWLKEVLADLAEAGIETVVFDKILPNPRDFEVMEGARVYDEEHCDVIVAVGGGSVIDCAKAIGIVSTNKIDVRLFEGVDQVLNPGPPLICIPTTAGTSADISQFCIIVNSDERYKMAIISKSMVPDVALVDPETTLSMDPYLTACTGIDALTHAIEAFVSTANSPIVDAHALAAMKLVWDNIETAVGSPGNVEAREKMMMASLQAGLAFSNASLGAVHALAHSLGGYLDLPHGECNALLLEHVARFNYAASPERFAQINQVLGLDLRGMSEKRQSQALADALSAKRKRVGIKDALSSRGVRLADISELSQHAIHDACLVTNPRHVDLPEVKALYGDAL